MSCLLISLNFRRSFWLS